MCSETVAVASLIYIYINTICFLFLFSLFVNHINKITDSTTRGTSTTQESTLHLQHKNNDEKYKTDS